MARDLFAQNGRDLFASNNQQLERTGLQQTEQVSGPGLQRSTDDRVIIEDPGAIKTGVISAGRGLNKIMSALGVDFAGIGGEETPEQKARFEELGRQRPISTSVGEAVGESIPFAVAPVGVIASVPGRIAATTALGALEGGLITKGSGGTEGEQIKGAAIGGTIAGSIEAGLPHVLRLGSKLVRKFLGKAPKTTLLRPDGSPTSELSDALDSAGVEFEDLQEAAMDLIAQQPPGAVPEQAARAARFEDTGIPATKGDITQEFGQQAIEARLFESAADPLSEPLRSLRLQQSQGLTGSLESIIEKAGVPENIGTALKESLSGRKALLKSKKNALYKAAAENAENVESLPFPITEIETAIPDGRTLREIGDLVPNQVEAVKNLLSEFGIDTSEEAVKRLADKGIDPIPMDITTFDIFRKSLNRIERSDQTNAIKVITGPIKNALDNEAENLAGIFQKAGIIDENILGPLKEARATVRQLKTEFSPQAITGKLIDAKRDGITPVIEASQVFKNIVGTNKPIELLERTITSLKQAGPKGIEAIGDLQAATVFDLIESAFKAETRKVQGAKTFGTVPFNKRLAQIGDDKLNLIFSTNPGLLKDLKKVSALASDLTPPSGAVPKGSASVILDTMNKIGLMTILGKVPGGGLLAEGITKLSEGQATRRAVGTALDATPEAKRIISVIESELPSVAVAFGLMAAKPEKEETK